MGVTMGKCGKETQVYSRVCGYHSPVKNWNLGKKEEMIDRLVYKVSWSSAKKQELVNV